LPDLKKVDKKPEERLFFMAGK
jgi:hypothetical protein